MGASLAHSAERTSPWSRESSSWRRISARSIPRRRCVGATPTVVTPAAGTWALPGTVICNEITEVVPTIWSRSNTARERPGSNSTRESRMSSSVACPPNGTKAARTKSSHWSSWRTRMSNSTRLLRQLRAGTLRAGGGVAAVVRRPPRTRADLPPALGFLHEPPEPVPGVVVADHPEQHDGQHHREHDHQGDLDHHPQDPAGGGKEQQQHQNHHRPSMVRDARRCRDVVHGALANGVIRPRPERSPSRTPQGKGTAMMRASHPECRTPTFRMRRPH